MSVSPSERKELYQMLRVFREAGYVRFRLARRGTAKEMSTDPRRWTKLGRAFVEASK